MSETTIQEDTCTWLQKREPGAFNAHMSRPQDCLWRTGNHGHLPARSNITRMEFTVTLLRLINTVRVQKPGPSGKSGLSGLVWSSWLSKQALFLQEAFLSVSDKHHLSPTLKCPKGWGDSSHPKRKVKGCMVGLGIVFASWWKWNRIFECEFISPQRNWTKS